MRENHSFPTVALRARVVLPGETTHFDISRKKSMAAIEAAMQKGEKLFLIAQRDPDALDPDAEGLFQYGTLCEIRQLARLPQDMGRVVVEGTLRCRMEELLPGQEFLSARVAEEPRRAAQPEDPATAAMLRIIRGKLK
ncbi:MAG: LON peptidase substrate-binding domain-containing protein, partial [Lachnospiraceae bacterium]